VQHGLVISKTSPEGNIFYIMAIVSQFLGREDAEKMKYEVTSQGSYEAALEVIKKYVPVISFID